MLFNVSFREYFFYYLLLIIIVVTGAFSYFRFMVNHDYVVYYEGECDPNTESCFVGCENDDCTKEHFYSKVQKYAPDLLDTCGDFIDGCVEANICLSSDRDCSITYCNSEIGDDVCAVQSSDEDTLLELEKDNIE